MSFRVENDEIEKLLMRMLPTSQQMSDVAFYMLQLVEDRFRTQGSSGGAPWPEKKLKEWGYDDGRAILTGTTGLLRKSFGAFSTNEEAIVGSWAPYSVVHQMGTVGKGGLLPTIKPKKAKALFIPITDKAIKSVRFVGWDAGALRVVHKLTTMAIKALGPYRASVKENRKDKTTSFTPLIKGRLYKGKLQKWDKRKQEYVDGVPDYIFLKKVDIPPRRMLPTSPQEIVKIVNFFGTRMLRMQ